MITSAKSACSLNELMMFTFLFIVPLYFLHNYFPPVHSQSFYFSSHFLHLLEFQGLGPNLLQLPLLLRHFLLVFHLPRFWECRHRVKHYFAPFSLIIWAFQFQQDPFMQSIHQAQHLTLLMTAYLNLYLFEKLGDLFLLIYSHQPALQIQH